GGVPGGVPGGVIGGVLGGMPSVLPPSPTVRAPAEPVRVGGNVRAPRLLERVAPVYPRLARQARVEGDVRIDATIDPRGRVVKMRVLAGNPLLVKAALAALEQWLYEPVYLDGQPVALLLEVTIHFELG
ncbi:MAG: energy transducer TonB, partial [Terriglobia bacterium]